MQGRGITTEPSTVVAVCSCEDTMTLDLAAIARGAGGAELVTARHLCRSQVERFRGLIAGNVGTLRVACTQEAPLFQEIADEANFAGELSFFNIRELAGWSDQGASAGPTMAALVAAAAEGLAPTHFGTPKSAGGAPVP